MSARSLFARALAAGAAVGIAIAAPATGAGAATNPQPRPPIVSIAPLGVTVNLGSTSVVNIGGTAAPGVVATVPVDGHTTATVGQPALPAAAAPGLVTAAPALAPAAPALGAVIGSSGRLVDADVALHACVAVALLEGRAPTGCALPAGSPTPSLADALAQVGICARVAVLASGPVTPCGTPASGATGGAAMPPSLVGIDGDAQVCAAATVLGLADPARCPAGNGDDPATGSPTVDGSGAGNSGSSENTGGTGGTTVDGNVNVCFGLAVLTATDTSRCTDPASTVSGNDGSTVGANEAAGATPALLADTSGSGTDPGGTDAGELAFTGAGTLLLTFAGLGSVASGLALRRSTRIRRVG